MTGNEVSGRLFSTKKTVATETSLPAHVATRDVAHATTIGPNLPRHPLDDLGLGALDLLLPAQLVDSVIAECGRREQRRRALPARVALYFVLALWFFPGVGYAEVLRRLFQQLRVQVRVGRFRIPSVAAAVQARRRLGRAPLKALFRLLLGTHADPMTPGMSAFGYTLTLLKVSVDGTKLDVADTAANRAAFGGPPQGRSGSGRCPQIRVLTLIATGTRAIVDAAWSRRSTGELSLLDKLIRHGSFTTGMLVLADRYFSGYPQVSRVAATGAHLIFRSQAYRHHPVLKQFPDGSYLSVLPAADLPSRSERLRAKAEGRKAPRRGLRARQAAGMPIRVIEAEVTVIPDKGSPRTEAYRLITTILDPTEAPAEQIARLYAERWESETGYADLKTYLRSGQSVLRSKDPDGVAQELYALLIVYQLVQITRARAADGHPGLDLHDRVSFTVTLRALVRTLSETIDAAALFDAVIEEIWDQPVLTRRPRTKPRERKGTAAFARAIEQNPPSIAQYKITIRTRELPPP